MPALALIYAELLNGPVIECPLVEHQPRRRSIRGYCSSKGVVSINPIPDILDTLVHELLHRHYPQWSERTVKRETTRFIRRLTPEDQQALYDHYSAIKLTERRKKAVQ